MKNIRGALFVLSLSIILLFNSTTIAQAKAAAAEAASQAATAAKAAAVEAAAEVAKEVAQEVAKEVAQEVAQSVTKDLDQEIAELKAEVDATWNEYVDLQKAGKYGEAAQKRSEYLDKIYLRFNVIKSI